LKSVWLGDGLPTPAAGRATKAAQAMIRAARARIAANCATADAATLQETM
jgi:hypothetical protein